MGKTRKDAQQQAAEHALHSLAEKYVAYITPLSQAVDKDFDTVSRENENGFLWDLENSRPGSNEALREDGLPKEKTAEPADIERGSTSSARVNQQAQNGVNSPR
ncbi:hypothetical protein SLEP1_g31874 [Rubroshorea leprosula]|uniref:DRBM domain-containing protein n=1 Tax=Rubroshorea leprosula TaxID=152421 RepID=A0AAV5KBK4_9ROSI|nr:hypothetical protein SLEP1_g31874 [Rubroshorea leprosula]